MSVQMKNKIQFCDKEKNTFTYIYPFFLYIKFYYDEDNGILYKYIYKEKKKMDKMLYFV